MRKIQSGFTLIELLVVIAIIGILVAAIMVSIADARNKGKDAAAIQSMKEFEKLLLIEYSETGTYANLQIPISNFYTPEDCALGFTASTYVTEAQAICTQIVKNTGVFTVGHLGGADPDVQKYSISTSLNSPVFLGGWPTGHDYCLGSSGSYNGTSVGNGNATQKGCLNNP